MSGDVGAKFAHFSFLGVLFAFLAASCAFVGSFLLMFVFFSRFGSLRVGFGDVQGHFGGAETAFFGALSCGGVCNSTKLRMHKNHSFSCVFVWFLHIASFVFKPQNNAKSFPGPVQQSFLQRLSSHSVLKWILEGFGALWGVT